MMIHFSAPISPTTMTRGEVFAARQYPRQAFAGLIDPVLNIDWFEMTAPTFPAHPHAGFSAVTYLFADSPNGFHNRDSLGEDHIIRPGGLHWSRASMGMIHEEIPLTGGGAVHGLQIFLNLPAAHQSDAAGAYPLSPDAVQLATGHGWTSRTAVNGTAVGSTKAALPAPVRIAEIGLDRGAAYPLDLPKGWGGIVIAIEGAITLGDQPVIGAGQAIGLAADSAETLPISAIGGPSRAAVVIGQQLNQPIHAHGPLMLASAEALDQARAYVGALSIPQSSNFN